MPDKIYQATLAERKITLDAAQHAALTHFTRLHQALIKHQGLRSHWQRVPRGIYCYGPVGRGKTLLMDLFFTHLPREDKTRIHFHAFMQHIHRELHQHKGHADPLALIAQEFARTTRLLCLDEMMVDDVADAMILARLFTALRKNGVIMVLTSNTAPDDLYRNGVQRQNFLPAIQLIKDTNEVVFIGQGQDYRIQTLIEAGVFFTPLTQENARHIQQEFDRLAGDYEKNKTLDVLGRKFQTLACGDHIVWFSFKELCQKPRAYPDYLALAQQFTTFFITDMPVCETRDDAAIRRFVHLIDVLYDAKITLILSAAAEVPDLYLGQDLKKEYARTMSRLMEMRTPAYWQHRT